MDGTLLDDTDDHDGLVASVLAGLLVLRGRPGRLTIQKFGQFPTLVRVCGGGDLLDAYLMFGREMARYRDGDRRDEAAAAWSITAEADSVLDRLQLTAEALSADEWRDQRTARRWSDACMPTLAADFVYFAEVQGRLGQELIKIEISGNNTDGLDVVIDQMVSRHLHTKAPLVRVWRHHGNDHDALEEVDIEIDLDDYGTTSATNGDLTMRRHRLHLDSEFLAQPTRTDDGPALTISVEGCDAPMRTFMFEDQTEPRVSIAFASYRTIAAVDVAKRALDA